MTETRSSFGGAITRLGLEDKFLANGELTRFQLVDRGRIANDIISEKLRLGRWQTVVEMIYGGVGKADALFEGNFDESKEGILKSAVEHSKGRDINQKTVELLAKAGEDDLLFRLATGIQSLDHHGFIAIAGSVKNKYFDEDPQRLQTYHETAGNKALESREYDHALTHFDTIDNEGLSTKAFHLLMSSDICYLSVRDLERVALGNERQKEDRLRRIVLSCLAEEERHLKPIDAFDIYI